MRLLHFNSSGKLLSTNFTGRAIPSYAILSHTWGDDEFQVEDLVNSTGENKVGYKKILFCRDQAARDGLQYFWIDTCCIDTWNLRELSNAINSMFLWYRNATKCYVYLSDVLARTQDGEVSHAEWASAFRNSRWFTRGWTLQELLAPKVVEFYSRDHVLLGNKSSPELESQIHETTGIAIEALQGHPLSGFSVEERFKMGREATNFRRGGYGILPTRHFRRLSSTCLWRGGREGNASAKYGDSESFRSTASWIAIAADLLFPQRHRSPHFHTQSRK